jgi:hypothetical protein
MACGVNSLTALAQWLAISLSIDQFSIHYLVNQQSVLSIKKKIFKKDLNFTEDLFCWLYCNFFLF